MLVFKQFLKPSVPLCSSNLVSTLSPKLNINLDLVLKSAKCCCKNVVNSDAE